MGQLKIIPHGVQLTGQTLIMDLLRASSIRSKHGQPITIGKSSHMSLSFLVGGRCVQLTACWRKNSTRQLGTIKEKMWKKDL